MSIDSQEIPVSPLPDLRRSVIRSDREAEALHAQVLNAAERTASFEGNSNATHKA